MQPLNIIDAYKHPTFNAEVDAQSGYRTKSILCVPIKTTDGFVVGVIEMINKLETIDDPKSYLSFTDQDQTVLQSFTDVIAGALANSLIFTELETHTSIVESTLQGITSYIITLDNQGRLKTSNHDLEELFGSDLQTMRSKNYSEWVNQGGDNEGFMRNIASVYETRKTVNVKNEVLRVQAKAGSSLTVNYNIVPLQVETKKRRFSRRGSELMRRGSLLVSKEKTDGERSGANSPASSPSRSVTHGTGMDQVGGMYNPSDDPDNLDMQGIVIVLENITEGRLRMSAIQRYQRRLNEMESQVKEFSDLRDKLQSLEIDDVADIKPETYGARERASEANARETSTTNAAKRDFAAVADPTLSSRSRRSKQLAKLALCLNETEVSGTGGAGASIRQTMMYSNEASPPTSLYGSGSPNTKSFVMEYVRQTKRALNVKVSADISYSLSADSSFLALCSQVQVGAVAQGAQAVGLGRAQHRRAGGAQQVRERHVRGAAAHRAVGHPGV